jgi:hypothetical protein
MDTMRSIVLRGNILNVNEDSPNEAANCLELIPNNHLKERKPTEFYINFIEEGYHIQYSLHMDIGYFLEESYPRKVSFEKLVINDFAVFERNERLELNYTEKLSSFFQKGIKNFDTIYDVACDSLNNNELFLINGFKLIISRKLVDLIQGWFKNKFMVICKANALQLIKRFNDPQKSGLYVDKTINEAAKIFGLDSNAVGYAITPDDQKSKLCSIVDDNHSDEKIIIKADIFESHGTLRFINIFPLIIKAIYTGAILIIDEFDASIHPMALMNIINIFHDDEININNAQLVFDTHNPIFLNSNIFRRDEIKFVERNQQHESELYSLSDFGTSGKNGVRKNEDYMKNYFVSQYGAIKDIDFSPIFKELISKNKGED